MNPYFTFTNEDIKQIQSLDLNVDTVLQQAETLLRGNLFVSVMEPATVGKGIMAFSEKDITDYISEFEEQIKNKKLLKFVPASGAATRMFKDLFIFQEKYAFQQSTELHELKQGFIFMEGIKKSAFYHQLKYLFEQKHISIDSLMEKRDFNPIIQELLYEEGLNYASLPKGLLLFHAYDDEQRTAFEEHLVEGSEYARNADGSVYLHFTVSPEHKVLFEELYNKVRMKYEERYDVHYQISFSFQSPKTNTVSLTEDNQLFRNNNGSLEFRPGGHGSLLENLSQTDADVVFIKNIDNVTTDLRKKETINYKKLLCVLLLKIQRQCFEYLKELENRIVTDAQWACIERFIQDKLNIQLPSHYTLLSHEEKQKMLFRLLNRPLRVCGMVKRQNEPGGGPFWIVNSRGEISLQIVETTEIDLNEPNQSQCLEASEFFNPVDIVCGLKNYKGEKFDLSDYMDTERYFISIKSKNGKILKALEHPGLWNGAMSEWNSLFVAVPLSTFTPVKTVNDLLREEHCE